MFSINTEQKRELILWNVTKSYLVQYPVSDRGRYKKPTTGKSRVIQSKRVHNLTFRFKYSFKKKMA